MRMIFVNLPVEDVDASRAFFTRLGIRFDPDFGDGSCACMVIDRNIFAMLMHRRRFGDLVNAPVSDAFAATEVLTCLSADSREQVDRTVTAAIDAGGRAWRPTIAQGPLYGGSFQDLDGHVWEILHVTPPTPGD